MLVDDFGYDGKVLNTNDRPLVKNIIRALSSGLSNVLNAKYLAHLTHQTQK